MTNCQILLLNLLSKTLFNKNTELTLTDEAELLREAKNQAVVQLVYDEIKDDLSEEAEIGWREYALASFANNMQVIYNHALLNEWLSAESIPYVILKGCSSAFYYPNPKMRGMGDVDFLVPGDQLDKAGEVLEKHGLKSWKEKHIAHIVYCASGMHYEMHFDAAGVPNGEAGDLVHEYLADIYEKSSLQPIEGGEVVMPSPFHHGLILLLHTCHHMTGGGIGLRHLCDWAVFENGFSEEEFRNLFEEPLKSIGLWKFAQVLTGISVKYLGADEKGWAEYDSRIVDMLMEDILAGGNFGIKDGSRSMQTMLISNHGKDGVGKTNMIMQLVKSINNTIYLNWPKARKCKLMLPIGWFFWGVRRIIRELTGKRKKTDIKQTVKGASYRRKLYKQLNIYERETTLTVHNTND